MSPKSPVHFPCTSLARTGSEAHRAGKGGAGSSGFGAAAGDSLASVSAGGQEIGWQTCALTRPATKNRPHPCMRIQFRKRPPDCWGFRGVWPFAIPPVLRKHSCYCSLPIPPWLLRLRRYLWGAPLSIWIHIIRMHLPEFSANVFSGSREGSDRPPWSWIPTFRFISIRSPSLQGAPVGTRNCFTLAGSAQFCTLVPPKRASRGGGGPSCSQCLLWCRKGSWQEA